LLTTSVNEKFLIACKYAAIAIAIAILAFIFGSLGMVVGDMINPGPGPRYVSFLIGVVLGLVLLIGLVQIIREADKR
jgi:hypothetical protein